MNWYLYNHVLEFYHLSLHKWLRWVLSNIHSLFQVTVAFSYQKKKKLLLLSCWQCPHWHDNMIILVILLLHDGDVFYFTFPCIFQLIWTSEGPYITCKRIQGNIDFCPPSISLHDLYLSNSDSIVVVIEVLSTKITPLKQKVEVIEGDAMEE